VDELRIAASTLRPPEAGGGEAPAPSRSGFEFARMLGDAIRDASESQMQAEQQARELAAGRGSTLEAVLAITKADLSLRFLLQVRNRALEAYNEIIRTQV
jgi:flagellar hook-basal body complex protein FliE